MATLDQRIRFGVDGAEHIVEQRAQADDMFDILFGRFMRFNALAGVHLTMGIQGKLISGLAPGLGLDAIIVVLLARNNPLLVPVTGLFYAYLRVGGSSMETQSSVGSELVLIIQAVIILLVTAQVLVDFVKRRRATSEPKGLKDP